MNTDYASTCALCLGAHRFYFIIKKCENTPDAIITRVNSLDAIAARTVKRRLYIVTTASGGDIAGNEKKNATALPDTGGETP